MKNALTLLELIFVLVILGILAAVGATAVRPRPLPNDARYIALKIMHAQYEGLFFDHRDFDGGEIGAESDRGCLVLEKTALEENATEGRSPYRIRSTLSGDLKDKKLCFDHLGRPSEGDHSHPLTTVQELDLGYGGKTVTLSVFPLSGYVTIH